MTAIKRYALLAFNLILHGFHQVWILFIVVGWMSCETRLLHLVVLLLTLASWYGLGPLLDKGSAYGYCVITDLQWVIRRQLALESRRGGYLKYLADSLSGRDFDETLVDRWGAAAFFACFFMSLITNFQFGSCPIFSG